MGLDGVERSARIPRCVAMMYVDTWIYYLGVVWPRKEAHIHSEMDPTFCGLDWAVVNF